MRKLWGLVPLLFLVACGDGMSEEEQAAENARLSAEVEQANGVLPEPESLALQVIGFPDMEAHQLYGTSCAFVPEGGGLGAVFLAMQQGGHFKRGGEIVTLAPDSGSAELPYGGREVYSGTDHTARLTVTGDGVVSDAEAVTYDARLVITDAEERPVYDRSGKAQCGA